MPRLRRCEVTITDRPDETYEVTEHQLHADWPVAVLIVLALALTCAGNTALRESRSKKMLTQGFEHRH